MMVMNLHWVPLYLWSGTYSHLMDGRLLSWISFLILIISCYYYYRT